jgi:hypothetical protein
MLNKSIKRSHEMPLWMLEKGYDLAYNNYFYALVHLFEESPEYYEYTIANLRNDREVVLDNSIFELGEAFDNAKFENHIKQIIEDVGEEAVSKYLTYIIPDSLDNADKTLENVANWNYDIPGKRMAVVQGDTSKQMLRCYTELNSNDKIDIIGISFNCKPYETSPDEDTKLLQWKTGRELFVDTLHTATSVTLKKPIHLLGCSLPSEFLHYKNNPRIEYNIYSMDTSNPVVHGLLDIDISPLQHFRTKKSIKLVDLFYLKDVESSKLDLIIRNIKEFRAVCERSK